MPARYRVWLRDQAGQRVAWLDGYYYLEYIRRLNDPGRFELHLPADHWAGGFFQLDGEVSIYRLPEGGIWSEEHAGLARYSRQFYDGAEERLVCIGRGAESLLSRRIIIPPANQEHDTQGPAAADAVVKTYVNNHAGPGAGARAIPTLYVQAVSGTGTNIEAAIRYAELLKTVQDLVEVGGIDFAVAPIYTLAGDDWAALVAAGQEALATTRIGWQFRTYFPQRGLDRTRGNAFGNPPTVFSLTRGNMTDPSYIYDAISIGNICHVLGQGQGVDRMTQVVVDGASVGLSPYNTWEYQRDARGTRSDYLVGEGTKENEKMAAREEFSFTAIESVGCLYGVHWTLGDLCTAEYAGATFTVQCIEIGILLNDSGERVQGTFRTVV